MGFRTSHSRPILFYPNLRFQLSYAAMHFSPNFLSMLSKTWKNFSPVAALPYQLSVAPACKASPRSLGNQRHLSASMAHLKACVRHVGLKPWPFLQQKSHVLLEWHRSPQASNRKLQAVTLCIYKSESLAVLVMNSDFHRMLGTASQKLVFSTWQVLVCTSVIYFIATLLVSII